MGLPMEDENFEFMEKAVGVAAGGDDLARGSRLRGRDRDDMGPADEAPAVGSPCQYTILGGGSCSPVSKTQATLVPAIYRINWDPEGRPYFTPQNIPVDKLVLLPDSRSEEVVKEIQHFWTLRARFNHYGYIHKRGFLLWGPPGSGKTSTLMFVMAELVRQGGVVFLLGDSSPNAFSGALATFRKIEPNRPAMVVLEDIDAIIQRRGESEVLSLLDGESSIDNVCYVATTNYPENLDGRVINRPSRFDRVVKIGMPSLAARLAYLKSRNLPEELDLQEWAKRTDDFSVAHLKELIVGVVCFGNHFEVELKRLRSMFRAPKSDDPKASVGFGA